MTAPNNDEQGIAVDINKVSQKAYTRIAALTLEVDQYATAYEDLQGEFGVVKAELAALKQAGERPVVDVSTSAT